jgi:hypothetical protein
LLADGKQLVAMSHAIILSETVMKGDQPLVMTQPLQIHVAGKVLDGDAVEAKAKARIEAHDVGLLENLVFFCWKSRN